MSIAALKPLHPMALRDGIADRAAAWLADRLGRNGQLCADSRRIRSGEGFLARIGRQGATDGHVAQAIAAGARAVAIDAMDAIDDIEEISAAVPTLRVPRLAARMGMVASAFYGRPSMAMQLIAVTGTNGKSTVTTALGYALARSGIGTAVIGTLGLGIFPAHCAKGFAPTWDASATAGLTTPDAVDLQRLLHGLRARSITTVAIEASSIGLEQGRLQGCAIKVAAFTNLSRDHLDIHGTMQAYAQAKALLFESPSLAAIVINTDSDHAMTMWQADDPRVDRIAIGGNVPANAHANICVEQATPTLAGWELSIAGSGQAKDLAGRVALPAYGRHNVDNALMVAGCLLAMSIDAASIRERLEELMLPPGRLQMVALDRAPWACVDYAHSPDALQRVLMALRPIAQARGGALVCVFGCGGDRDSGKRPLMGEVAARDADFVMLTSDNPRSESPESILDGIAAGVPMAQRDKVGRQSDRALAIAQAIAKAGPHDIVLIAGKGHEQTQVIGEQQIAFSDVDHAQRAIDGWLAEHPATRTGVMHA
jgi:UDP-N-acetylmuramyl-tripeptide synthetase